jgi:hypothetical protein
MLTIAPLAAHATGMFHTPQPLEASIAAAEVMVRARVLTISREVATEGSKREYCGTNYQMETLVTLKGQLPQRFTFSSYGSPHALPFYEVAVGDELLLLLNQSAGNEFLSWNVASDVIRETPSSAQQLTCARKLSKWKLSRADESSFLLLPRKSSSADQSPWIVYARSRTIMPSAAAAQDTPYDPACEGESCQRDFRRMVPWSFVEPEIRRWLSGPTTRR